MWKEERSISQINSIKRKDTVFPSATQASVFQSRRMRRFSTGSGKAVLPARKAMGWGLSIVKSIVLYHGLGLELRSEGGSGSEFIIRFPAPMLADRKK